MAFVAPLIAAAGAAAGAIGTGGSLATALSAAGAGLGAVSAIQEGHYRAAVAKNNAVVAEQQAAAESQRAQVEQMRSDREYAAALGEQLAAQGASGLDILGRSQLMTRNVTRRVGREAALDIRNQGTDAARRLMQDAANFRTEGKNAVRQGWMTAAGEAIGFGTGLAKEKGWTTSLASSGTRRRRPWDENPNWYGRG
jgi:hypothetical protein